MGLRRIFKIFRISPETAFVENIYTRKSVLIFVVFRFYALNNNGCPEQAKPMRLKYLRTNKIFSRSDCDPKTSSFDPSFIWNADVSYESGISSGFDRCFWEALQNAESTLKIHIGFFVLNPVV